MLLVFILLFLFIIYLIITDDRFLLNRKLIIIIIIFIIIIISYYINKTPYIIIKDLFWYSLILNASFIFHVILLNRIFEWCIINNKEYWGFIISRISFTLSISGLLYLLFFIEKYFYLYFSNYYIVKLCLDNYWTWFYLNKIKSSSIIFYLYTKIFNLIKNFLLIIKIILITFCIIFCKYTLFLQGKNKHNYTFNNICYYIIIFIIFLYLSIILEIPRLYIIWLVYSLKEYYNILNFCYIIKPINIKNSNILYKIMYIFKQNILNNKDTLLLYYFYLHKYYELDKIYELPYHKLFMFDLCKFLYNPTLGYLDFGNIADYDEQLNIRKYPIIKLYKYYSWEKIAHNYCNIWDYYKLEEELAHNYTLKNENIYDINKIEEALKWTKILNNKSLLYKLLSNLYNKDWVKKKYNL